MHKDKNLSTHKNIEHINEIIAKLLKVKKIKSGMKNFLKKSRQEVKEYKEAGQILKNFIKTGKVSKEDSKKVYLQLLDTFKIGGNVSIWLIPGGSLLLVILIKLAEKWNINLLPTSFGKK